MTDKPDTDYKATEALVSTDQGKKFENEVDLLNMRCAALMNITEYADNEIDKLGRQYRELRDEFQSYREKTEKRIGQWNVEYIRLQNQIDRLKQKVGEADES